MSWRIEKERQGREGRRVKGGRGEYRTIDHGRTEERSGKRNVTADR